MPQAVAAHPGAAVGRRARPVDQNEALVPAPPGGKLWGRPETALESPYLLTGVTACGVCGGSFFVRKRPDGRHPGRQCSYYSCTYHHLRGDRVWSNALTMPMADADEAVLTELREDILKPSRVALAIETAIKRYTGRPNDIAAQRAALEAEVRRLDGEISRLVDALASGDPLPSVQDAIRARERRRADARARLEHLDGMARMPRLNTAALTKELNQRLTEWQELLKAAPVKSRQILRKLIAGRLTFKPDPQHGLYTFNGFATYG